ncbi:MAG: GFA family protein [Rhodospirillales bacterium]|nr:GFA family protein [Rhodospirillales bacterium]
MREARCTCGELKVEVSDEPKLVLMCHCEECQRRTGAPFGVSAYFDQNDVRVSGTSSKYERTSDTGLAVTQHFCPTCGSTLYWRAAFVPDFIGVATGCFSDPDFPAPQRSVYERSKHEWVTAPHSAACFETTSI